ncbi:sugar phosphate isomerase/epimerase family protein [Enterovirga rhinocerotis]|uniref:Sugar phosphate isomerase/epimerase n=1 Tax=Enterovirga rhinocerotis TaxID=1339210 RepID=A0A4R7BYB1_9HYPH|nr:sugar phosphate isomerase/epimerase family protein [Enterovirga rhinocerotis]TDR90242.1 sugar phosphate isomerase/epimerase [Enterovirga rhinocerotis]
MPAGYGGGLAINHYITPEGYALERFLDDCAEAGATGVGLTERALAEMPLERLGQALEERSLRVTSVNSAGFFLWDDPQKALRQQEINAALIHAAAVLGADALVTITGGLHDYAEARPGDLKRVRSRVEQDLAPLIDAAVARDVRLGLEPMHPIRIPNKSTLNTLAQTERQLAHHPGLGFVLDMFHSWWDPDLEEVLERSVSRLRLVQLTGVAQPRGDVLLPVRCPLGEGLVDLPALLATLRSVGYRGHFEFELFAPDLRGATVAEAIRRAVAEFGAAWEG